MKNRLRVIGCFSVIACVWVGFLQVMPTDDSDEVGVLEDVEEGFVDTPANESIDEKDDSEIALTSFTSSQDSSAASAIKIRIRTIEFQDDPIVEKAWIPIWSDLQAPEPSSREKPQLGRNRVMSSNDIDGMLGTLTSQVLACVRTDVVKTLPVGRRTRWVDEVQWEVVPSVESDGLNSLSVKGSCWYGPSASQQTCVWKSETFSELKTGESLVIEGQTRSGCVMEVTQIPFLSDIPIVGDLLFSSRKMRTETHRILYVATVADSSESEEPNPHDK